MGIGIGKNIEFAAACAHFLQIGFELLQKRIVGGNGYHGHFVVDQRERAVLQFARCVGFRVDVGNFLELERPFQGNGIVHAAAEEQGVALVGKTRGPVLDLRFDPQGVLQRHRQMPQCGNHLALAFAGQLISHFRQGHGQQHQRRKLGRECFGGSHADFRPRACQETQVGLAYQCTFSYVADGETVTVPQRFRIAQGCQGVSRFAGLGDSHHQGIGADCRVAVAVFAGDLDIAGQSRHRFQPVASDHSGMIAGAAGQDENAADMAENVFRLGPEQPRGNGLGIEHHFQRIGDHPRLLKYFLLHEVVVGPHFHGIVGEFAFLHLARDFPAGPILRAVDDAISVAMQLCYIAILQIDHAASDLQQGGCIRGGIIAGVTQSQQQWGTVAADDDAFRPRLLHDRNGVSAPQFTNGAAYGIEQVGIVHQVK